MDRRFLRGNREIPSLASRVYSAGPHFEPQGGTMVVNEGGKSDKSVVPKKLANKVGGAPSTAESVEERDLAKGNSGQQSSFWTQDQDELQLALDRIRQVARKGEVEKFTTLWHHVYNVNRLRSSFFALKRKASAGVDGETWYSYREDLEANLHDLSERLKRGAYRAKPVRRTHIPKAAGRARPIGIPALEDKIVQRSTVEVMNAIYEHDFRGFSYGFRPGRSAHNALDAVSVGLRRRKVSWVLDADIAGFFDAISHEWLLRFIEHRISDKRIHRHVKKWLNAGVLEKGKVSKAAEGTPQGGIISPLLANIYLHYVFDLWADQWRNRKTTGDVIIVRYADDFVVGFQNKGDAMKFLADLKVRFKEFSLELHPDKTGLIRFGRFAAQNHMERGEGKPETFDFLGFTHICDKTRHGNFKVTRRTISKRMRKKLAEMAVDLRTRMHAPIKETGAWLRSVLLGHYRYYGVPGNHYSMRLFRDEITNRWRTVLRRRSHKTRLHWKRMNRIVKKWLPWPEIFHPYPEQRLCVIT
ncbi:MAG: group II intron reverse transcriptase/maturase [Planctomycetota bacterium]